jgi:hypothetical protein
MHLVEHTLQSQQQSECLVGLSDCFCECSVQQARLTQNNNKTVLFVETLHYGHVPYKHKPAWNLPLLHWDVILRQFPTQKILRQLQMCLR